MFAAAAVVFSFFTWKSDQSVLQGYTDEQRELLGLAVENLCGPLGTRIGEALVGRSFGVFGVLIPVMLILIGVRIIRQQPLRFNRSILPLLLVAILGSLTLGCLFGDRWCFCSSGGWGGAFGAEIASLWTIDLPVPHVGALPRLIGSVGTLLLLAGGWILTGVYINRSFIDRVNHAGNAVVDRSGRIFGVVRRKVAPHGVDDAELPADEEFVGEPDAEAGVAEAAGEADEVVPEETAPVREPQPADVPTSGRESVQEDAADENPFLDFDEERTVVRGGAAEDEVFVEVDLDEDRSAERVVMGAGDWSCWSALRDARSPRRTDPLRNLRWRVLRRHPEAQPNRLPNRLSGRMRGCADTTIVSNPTTNPSPKFRSWPEDPKPSPMRPSRAIRRPRGCPRLPNAAMRTRLWSRKGWW